MIDRTNHNALADQLSARLGIGGNKPPSMLELVKGTVAALSDFLKGHPVISNEDEARAAKLMKDRADAAVKDLEAERDGRVRPLNEQVKAINDEYRPIRDPLEKVIAQLKGRMTDYAVTERRKREAIAEAARREAQEAERAAREAEAAERAAQAEAAEGVCDVDIVDVTITADQTFSAYQRASRIADRAERDTKVRIGGGFGRTTSLRKREVLTVADAHAAIEEMGLTDTIAEAILTSARAYRKNFGELPEGISRTEEDTI